MIKNGTSETRTRGAATILGLFEDASRYEGAKKLQVLVKGLGELFEAETTFIAHALDDPATRVRGIAAWKDGAYKDPWEYDLSGNPCQLTYDGNPTFIPCDIAQEYENKKDSGYSSYIGIPLKSSEDKTIGHIAIYASASHEPDSYALEIAQIAGHLAQSEIQRIIAEAEFKSRIDELSSQQEISKETVRTVAHDIRSPLSAVIGILELAENGDNPNTVSDMVAGAKNAAKRLLSFASEYLDLERLNQASTANLKASQVTIKELIDGVISMTEEERKAKNITIAVHPYDDKLALPGSAQELERAISNLVSNAIKFSTAGDKIEISVIDQASNVKVHVRDFGMGIPKAMQDCLFEPFESGSCPDTGAKGSGLGLAIAKKVIERHGGDIGVENHDPGSMFFFSIPK